MVNLQLNSECQFFNSLIPIHCYAIAIHNNYRVTNYKQISMIKLLLSKRKTKECLFN